MELRDPTTPGAAGAPAGAAGLPARTAGSAPGGWGSRAARRLDVLLLVLALALAVGLGCYRITDPWEDGFRGINGGAYTGNFVNRYLELGLAGTRGCGITIVEPLHPPVLQSYVNHPSTYPLLVLLPCAVLGVSEVVIRGASLLLYLPAVLAVWAIARRFLGAPGAGAAALLFATAPMTAYWGPMANPDPGTMAASLGAIWAFLRYAERPGRGRAVALGALWVLACLMDWTGFFAGVAILLLVPLAADRRAAFRAALVLGALSLLPLLLIVLHTAWISRGFAEGFEALRVLTGNAGGSETPFGALLAIKAGHLGRWIGWPMLALGALGVAVGLLGGRAWRRALLAGLVLTLPGVLNALIFQHHAAIHDYWMMHSTPGLALLAAIPVAWAIARPARAAGGLALAALLGVAAFGARDTLATVDHFRTTIHRDLGALFNTAFGEGDVLAADVSLRTVSYYSRACLVGPIVRAPQARKVLERYDDVLRSGHSVGFVIAPREAETPLGKFLAGLGPRQQLGPFLMYRVSGR